MLVSFLMSSLQQKSSKSQQQARQEKGAKGGDGDKKTSENCTGVHVFEAAALSVLSANVTKAVKYEGSTKVVVTLECGGVDDKQKEELMAAANALIAADDVQCLHTAKCDGPHCAHAGEIQGLFLQKCKFRKKQGVVEFQFVIGAAATSSLAGSKDFGLVKSVTAGHSTQLAGATMSTAYSSVKSSQPAKTAKIGDSKSSKAKISAKCGGKNQVMQAVDEVFAEMVAALDPKPSVEAEQNLRAKLEPRLQSILNNLQNTAYSQGFESRSLPITKLWGVQGEGFY
eukprot:gb/GEZN01010021.1/.p1 GENE.gb/GEZN01010021.1/~~gb/GEZN01010021.1/.p1  ORF type:complete len:284 (+),score=42.36 gb/GEZN01010021.1/:101-952(+)